MLVKFRYCDSCIVCCSTQSKLHESIHFSPKEACQEDAFLQFVSGPSDHERDVIDPGVSFSDDSTLKSFLKDVLETTMSLSSKAVR
jgi:hypothetical protein